MPQPGLIRIRELARYVVRDRHGKRILTVKRTQITLTEPDGNTDTLTVTDSIETMDGIPWNPQFLDLKPPVLLGVCAECREPHSREKPTHGLVTIANMKTCLDCKAALCPAHAKLGSDDQLRCPPCARAFKFKSFVLWLFFSSSEDP